MRSDALTRWREAARRFIDAQRLGRRGAGPAIRGLVRLLLYVVAAVVVAVGVLVALSLAHPAILQAVQELTKGRAGIGVEIAAIALQTAVLLWAVRDIAVRTLRRPVTTFVAPAGRIEFRRVVAGAAAWAAGAIVVFAATAAVGALIGPARSALPAVHLPGRDWLLAIPLGFAVVPFQAASEELIFRGWLTQTLGQWIRHPVPLALAVGVLFAVVHGTAAGPLALPYFLIGSLGLSAISLCDGRLELAIGAHAAQNLFVLLIATPFLEGAAPTLFGSAQVRIGVTALLAVAAQGALTFAISRARAFRAVFGLDPAGSSPSI